MCEVGYDYGYYYPHKKGNRIGSQRVPIAQEHGMTRREIARAAVELGYIKLDLSVFPETANYYYAKQMPNSNGTMVYSENGFVADITKPRKTTIKKAEANAANELVAYWKAEHWTDSQIANWMESCRKCS